MTKRPTPISGLWATTDDVNECAMRQRERRQEAIGMIVLTLCLLAACVAWNAYFIAPQGARMDATMDCLDDLGLELNEANWERCWDIAVQRLQEDA
tara:strand:- start:227 stop:514 length:288 start_codon:yes stop_codon:yes gene_type:complete